VRHTRIQTKRETRQGHRRGSEHPLAEVKAFEARTGSADAAVRRGPPNGGAPLAARLGDNLTDEIGSESE
jgi:hypothetical protein